MHITEFDCTIHRIDLLALFGPGVNLGLPVEQLPELCSGILRLTHIWRERKDSSSRLGPEKDFGKADKEVEDVVFTLAQKGTSIPEPKGNTEENQRLRAGVEKRRLQNGYQTALPLHLKLPVVLFPDVSFPSKRCHSADG